MDNELNAIMGPELKSKMDLCDYAERRNKLENVTKMAINLEELDNSNNLEDGKTQQHLYIT